jgi:hypothetical protein
VLRSRSAHDHWQRRGFVQAEAVRSTANISVPAAGPHARACGTMPGQMRLAVFSEVHGRVERLSACLHSIARVGADELWCLGDTVDAFAVRQPELIVACVNAIDDVCAVKLTGKPRSVGVAGWMSARGRRHGAGGLDGRGIPGGGACRANPIWAGAPFSYQSHMDVLAERFHVIDPDTRGGGRTVHTEGVSHTTCSPRMCSRGLRRLTWTVQRSSGSATGGLPQRAPRSAGRAPCAR